MRYALNIDRAGRHPSISLYGHIGQQPPNLTCSTLAAFLARWESFNATGAGLELLQEVGPLGVDAQQFSRDLQAVGDAQQIDLYVNSPGGSVFDGLAIYSMLNRHPARKVAHVDALAASIASVICMACDQIEMAEPAQMMIHNALGVTGGDSAEMRKMADVLDQMTDTIAGVYSARSGNSRNKVKAWMAAEKWFTAPEAVNHRLADRIAPLKSGSGSEREMVSARLREIDSHESAGQFAVAARLRELDRHERQYSRR